MMTNNRLAHVVGRAPITIMISGLALLLFYCPWLALSLEMRTDGGHWLNAVSVLGCHLLHWSSEHLFWDLGMFAVTGYLCERRGRRTFVCTLGLAAVTIPCVVAGYHPELTTYRGLSGIDTALFALVISRTWLQDDWRDEPIRFWSCLLLWMAMFGKSAFELATGNVLFVNAENFVPVPVAHIVGMICGTAMAFSSVRGQTLGQGPGCLSYQSMLGPPPSPVVSRLNTRG